MDPWLESHLRLAEAKGCLTGRTSRVQEHALRMVLLMQRVDQAKNLFSQIKMEALRDGLDMARVRDLFPDYFPKDDPFEGAVREDGTVDPDLVDEDAIVFSVPRNAEEDEEISRWIREHEAGSVSQVALGEWV